MLDAVVIGGGQAGLATGYHLTRRGASFRILDAADEIGATWRRRWDSLVLFTPSRFDSLPGSDFPAPRDTYPTKDQVADYLVSYAERFELPVQLGTRVEEVTRSDDGFAVQAGPEVVRTRRVIVATGPFQVPIVPPVAGGLDQAVLQVHSDAYRNPASLPDGEPVLVVGGGNSGCQIAEELSATRRVTLAVGTRVPVLPQRPLGRDLWWWGELLGVSKVTADSRLGRRLRQRDPVIGTGPQRLARRHGVDVRPRVTATAGREVTFADGSRRGFGAVVWATGYAVDHSWVDVPEARGPEGGLVHRRGVTPADGLYVIGQTWQHRRGSALLGWVKHDVEFLMERMFG